MLTDYVRDWVWFSASQRKTSSSWHKVQAHTGHSLFLGPLHGVQRGVTCRSCRDAVLGLPVGDTSHIPHDEWPCCTTGLFVSGNM